MPSERRFEDGYCISDDPAKFRLDLAHAWISRESYWAEGIPLEVFRKAVEHSLAVGVYAPSGEMAAMARVVTDRATFAWISDVFVAEAHRGSGLGKRLMAYLKDHPHLQGLRRLNLATRDAHGLYAQFGFVPLAGAERWMEIHDPEVYRRSSPKASASSS